MLHKTTIYTFFIFIFFISFYLFYNMSLNWIYQTDSYLSDFPSHIRNTINIFQGELHFAYPVWHYLIYYSSIIFSLDFVMSSALISATVVTCYSIVIYLMTYYLLYRQSLEHLLLPLLVTLILLIVGPLDFPDYNKYYILGQWSPNIWYSPTFVMLKPFALLSIFFIVKTLKHQSFKLLTFTIIVAILSIFSKPSFIVVFLPAVLIYYFLRSNYQNKRNTIMILILFLSTVGSVFFQYSLLFSESSVSILVDICGVWSKYTTSILVSLVLGMAFPLAYLLLYPKKVYKCDYLLLSWIMAVISFFIAITFAESGERYMHGNFFWSYATSLNVLFIFSLILFIKHFDWKGIKTWTMLILLIAHIVFGYNYLVHILGGGYAL